MEGLMDGRPCGLSYNLPGRSLYCFTGQRAEQDLNFALPLPKSQPSATMRLSEQKATDMEANSFMYVRKVRFSRDKWPAHPNNRHFLRAPCMNPVRLRVRFISKPLMLGWGCGSDGRGLAQHALKPGFNHQHPETKHRGAHLRSQLLGR